MKPKFKKGDVCIVTDLEGGHKFDIGEEVRLQRWDDGELGRGNWKCVNDKGEFWYLLEDSLKLKS